MSVSAVEMSAVEVSAVKQDAGCHHHPTELDQRTQALLKESEARFRQLFEKIPNIPVQGYDRHRRVIFWNQASEKLYGYSREEALGQSLENLILPPELRDTMVPLIENWIAGGAAVPAGELNLRHKDGRLVPVFSSHLVLHNTRGEPEMYCVDLDLRDRKHSEQALKESEERYRSIFENITQGLFQLSPEGRYLSVNPFLVKLFGYESAEALQEQLTDLEQQLYVNPQHYHQLRQQLQTQEQVTGIESQVYRQDGQTLWVSETWRTVRNKDGQVLYYEGRLEDITIRRSIEAQLRYDAIHDQLTGLFNRSYLQTQLQQTLNAYQRGEIQHYDLLFIDLDRFKLINDSQGHLVGDKILQIVAQRFQQVITAPNVLSRFGGDEFVVLLRDTSLAQSSPWVAQRLIEVLQAPIAMDGESFEITASIGIAQGDYDYALASDLLRNADIAMYRAKAAGGGQSVCFDQEMYPRLLARLQLEADLKLALQEQQFQLFYQPIIDLRQGGLSGFEALLRWQHPQRGWISPAEFIPVAEEAKLIEPLSWWVFREAMRQLQCWRQQFPQAMDLTMNVNLSTVQLKQEYLAPQLQELLDEYGLPGDRLKLEVTETNFLEASDSIMQRFQELKQLGLGIGIDDFGTGYSSLSRLHQIPLDVLKIDRTFVDGLEQDAKKEAIAHSILLLAHGLGASVVAEGIETPEQLQVLQHLGCEFGQGYWFDSPLPCDRATTWIESKA